jgi:hypothetical protein
MAGIDSGGGKDLSFTTHRSFTASHSEAKGIYWETLVGSAETSNGGAVLCTTDGRGTTIAELRHTFDLNNATSLGDLADNTVVELHCFSNGSDGAADDNRLSTDAAFRRSITCTKGLCSFHRLRVLVSHLGSLSVNSGSEVTSETVIQLLRTSHNESKSRRMELLMQYLGIYHAHTIPRSALRGTQR